MFIIATNDRESGAYPQVEGAVTVDDAREKFVAAWRGLYDTSTAILVKINEDLSKDEVFRADTDTQGWDDEADDTFIPQDEIARLTAALAPYAA